MEGSDIYPLNFVARAHDNVFNFNFVMIKKVEEALNCIQSKKYPGLDEISATLLKVEHI